MDALTAAKMRIISRACVARYTEGERTMNNIVAYYNLSKENENYVKEEIIKIKPDFNFNAE